ncbi:MULTISPECIES: ATP-binding protein [unclassified Kitasatospora]|uniref:ATP-binding protein n=1 Tax=unclassified Kitasatospora TaxID=2633591 RepID=UPI00380DEF31
METEASLESRIAALAEATEDEVRNVFATYGLPLVSTPARPRALRLRRLRVAGLRTGAVAPGSFDSTIRFNDGVTALVAPNLRGKTSVLELVTWCLRGAPRELQTGVRHWLSFLDLDAVVAGQPLGFRLDLEDGEIVSALVLAGPDVDRLADTRLPIPGDGIVPLLRASRSASFTEQVQALMMDRLDLQPLVNSVKGTSTQSHGWPAYYGALYLPAGGDKVLLGDQSIAGLPGRLLQVFLDLPATAALARVKTAQDLRATEERSKWAAADTFAQSVREQREHAQTRLSEARARLTALSSAAGGPKASLSELAARSVVLANGVADKQERWEELMAAHRQARAARQRDAKLLNDVSESAVARRLFHGLDPTACPRCDKDIEEERRQRERSVHACAVCDRPVEAGGDEAPEDVITEAKERLAASSDAEKAARDALEDAEAALGKLTEELTSIQGQLRAAESAAQLPALVEAREDVLRWEGALSVLPEATLAAVRQESSTVKILKSGAKVLEEDSRSSGSTLFAALNQEITELGHRFGIVSLEAVEIDRAGRLKVIKDGTSQDWFSKQSAGERLRLRIAVVIALLRVGAAHGVSTHPGLVLIDSPKAEEVQDLDALTLLKELAAVAEENALQIVVTTADPVLAHEVLPEHSIVEATDGHPLW